MAIETETNNQPVTDIRVKQLSYSSRLLLHACPRKYQLYKLSADENTVDSEQSTKQSVTFAFGHVVGLGIQNVFQNLSEDQIYWNAFLMWEPDLLADDIKAGKSFWSALAAVQRFMHMRAQGFMKDWEIVSLDGKQAAELSFLINFPDGYTYKGFVDLVLQHRESKEVMVIEVKTTKSSTINAAAFKNSAQAVGYSVVLDVPFPKLSSYVVKYIIYKTKTREFEVMDFTKDYLSRALWIREILLDIEKIKLHEAAGIYSMHGESCNDFFRECEYMGICTLATDKMTVALTPEITKAIEVKNKADFEINLDIKDLIRTQLAKELL